MVQETTLSSPQNLKLHEPDRFNYGQDQKEPESPNQWFVQRYKLAYETHGSPFLQLTEPVDRHTSQVHPITINIDFFAAVLGGRKDLGHHIIYYETELAWYFKDSDNIYKNTTSDKLGNVYRSLLMSCAQDMPANVHKLNLVHEWRSDKVAKAVVNRAKSVLAADHTFFSPTSPHQRIRGPELHERLARKYVDELLSADPGQVLQLHDAYLAFCGLLKQRDLEPVKRSDFKAIVVPMIRDEFNVCLRNDLVVDGKPGIRGWKNVRLNQAQPA